MPISPQEQSLIDQELAETRQRLEAWVHRELANPVPAGQGRNNQMGKLTPRMIELGFDEQAIFDAFQQMYELEDGEKDAELWKVIRSSAKYATTLRIEDPEEIARQKRHKAEVARQATRNLKLVMTDYAWSEAEIIEAGGCRGLKPDEQRQMFMLTLWNPDDVIWCGAVHHSGKPKHRNNWRTRDQWLKGLAPGFEFTAHCTWKAGTYSRANEYVEQRRYLVVESDSLTRDEVGAVFRWLVTGGLHLRAVIYSGGKSLHGWFDWPDNSEALGPELTGLKCDPSVMRASQPVRLAGVKRKDTQKIQSLLYLSA